MAQLPPPNDPTKLGTYINSVIAATPQSPLPAWGRSGGSVIKLDAGVEYELDVPVVVPDSVNLGIICDLPWGAIVRNKTGDAYPLFVEGRGNVGHVFKMKGVCLIDGGVNVNGLRRGKTKIQECKIYAAPEHGIYVSPLNENGDSRNGLAATRWTLSDTEIFDSAVNGLHIEGKTYQIGRVDGGSISRSGGINMFVDATGVKADHVDFFGAGGPCLVNIAGQLERSSHVSFSDCRFGNEGDQTEHTVIVGPVDGPGPINRRAAAVRFSGNYFSAKRNSIQKAALLFNDPAIGCRVLENTFSVNYSESAVKCTNTANARNNTFFANVVPGALDAFSGDPNASSGWDQ